MASCTGSAVRTCVSQSEHWGPQGADVDSAGALPRGPDTRGALGTQGPLQPGRPLL